MSKVADLRQERRAREAPAVRTALERVTERELCDAPSLFKEYFLTQKGQGIVYFLSEAPEEGWVWTKIGWTRGLTGTARCDALRAGNPRALAARAELWGRMVVELAFHELWREARGRGEWFLLPTPLLQDAAATALDEAWELGHAWNSHRLGTMLRDSGRITVAREARNGS
jgi:hypothetical protein